MRTSCVVLAATLLVSTRTGATQPAPVQVEGTVKVEGRVDIRDVTPPPPPGTGKFVDSKTAEAALDEKTFPLLSRGVAIGAGLGLHTHAKFGGAPELRSSASTPFAYLAVLPGYWSEFEETNSYCASFQTKAGIARADRVAVKLAIEDAEADPAKTDDLKHGLQVLKDANTYDDVLSTDSAGANGAGIRALHHYRHWKLRTPAACGWRKVGVFVARSTSFKADIRVGENDTAVQTTSKELRPIITFGALIAPKPYVHILVGLTVSAFEHSAGTDDPADNKYVTSLFSAWARRSTLSVAL